MAAKAYYSEIDPHTAQWLRNLIAVGAIAPGFVDERDIRDVKPDDLKDFAQCHFFAGIGVWSYSLRQAGWEDSRKVWTGSCPCQSFSAAGKRAGFADERHLWPAFHWLIHQCRPETVFGEQVASKDGLAWLDLVCADLEGTSYTGWVGDLCAAGVGAPQIRQRLFFVAERLDDATSAGRTVAGRSGVSRQPADDAARRSKNGGSGGDRNLQHGGEQRLVTQDGGALRLAGAEGERLQWRPDDGNEGRRQRASGQGCEASELGDARRAGLRRNGGSVPKKEAEGSSCWVANGRSADKPILASDIMRPGPTNGFWQDADWIGCTDGKWRPVKPESQCLVDGSAFRVGSGGPFENKSRAKMLKGYGNAIVAPLAIEFIKAAMECMS